MEEKLITIAIDAMGGDHGPSVTVPAALKILHKFPHLSLILVGDETTLQQTIEGLIEKPAFGARLHIQHASQSVAMDELPLIALRTKKDSSLRVALNLVKEGKANACVSAGNTGALMATARFVLKTLPGIDRPAIISTFPTLRFDKDVRILDLGANVDSTAEHLLQFAIMGAAFASAIDNIPNPKVYLLNIGEEEIKGNEQVKRTAQLLSQTKLLNYAGYIEGDALYQGHADVIVCDGFVGNVALKTTEGVAKLITSLMKEAFMRNWLTKIIAYLAKPILRPFIRRIDPSRYNGATFIGLNGTVIKSHGSANVLAFMCAIEEAIAGVQKNVPNRICHEIDKLLKASSS